MLYLNRKPGDGVIINHTIEIRVIEVRGKTVKLGFDFPEEASVLRAEIVEEVKAANRGALDTVHCIGDQQHIGKAEGMQATGGLKPGPKRTGTS